MSAVAGPFRNEVQARRPDHKDIEDRESEAGVGSQEKSGQKRSREQSFEQQRGPEKSDRVA